jgi:hypothetical protein
VDRLNAKARQAQARLQPDLTGKPCAKMQDMPVNSASLASYYLSQFRIRLINNIH